MAVNKVEANGETLIDLTDDTVTADSLLAGRTAHLASGVQVTGTFEPVTGVKGNAESAYRKGNVNLTPANFGLGNVDNTSDANKPISTAAQAEFDKQQAQIDKALEQTGYNLFKITSFSNTVSNGITYTVNTATGIVTANGTVTSGSISILNLYLESNVFGNLNLSGCANGGSPSTYDVLPFDVTTSVRPTNWAGTSAADSVFSEDDVTEVKYIQGHTNIIQIRVRSGVTVSNLQFKPMLTKPELAGVPFQPYAMSNVELTQYVSSYELIPKVDSNHNGIFRGDDLTLAWVENGKIKESLYTKIHSGDFSGLYLGDYFTVSITTDIYTRFTGSSFVSGTTYYTLGGKYPNWDYTATTDTAPTGGKAYFTKQTVTENVDLMIAAFDYYYNAGDTAPTSHHLVLIPRNYGFKTTAKMNSTNTTTGSYYNCEMHQTTLPCYAKSLKTALNNHLLSHGTILPNAINASIPSMAGAGFTGASTNWAWYTTELQLMSEQQVYGTRAWTSSAYDIGLDYRILPVFNFINPVLFGRTTCWLRSVVSSTLFALCGNSGYATNAGASYAHYVRPLILFG